MEPNLQEEILLLRRERDLYRRILELSTRQDLEPLLKEALALITEVTCAKKGYLALYGEQGQLALSIAKSYSESELEEVKQKISQGIIAYSMASGQAVHISSASEDERFRQNKSVRENSIEAVLCVPIGVEPPLGVLYLQERNDAEAFTAEDRERADLFAVHLAPAVDRILSKQREQKLQDATLPYRARLKLSGIIGRSAALADILHQIESAARFEVAILLTGPSGTGKTATARAIHENSQRAKGLFLELNCAAIPESLFESELFGAAQGAHSTATKKIPGKLAAAEGGTLFLDEISELPLPAQSKLLQFLQSKEYFPLGAIKPEKADVRIIAATNTNLREAISQKIFREDLFYRLNVVPIRLLPLSERREDIVPLLEHFCETICQRHKVEPLRVSMMAKKAAEATDWPGNIRQLANAVEAAIIRAVVSKSPTLEPHHLFSEAAPDESTPEEQLTFQDATKRYQRKFLLQVIEACQWNLSEVARRLNLTRNHINNLMIALDLRKLDPRRKNSLSPEIE